jgi:hypothetical protein
MAIIITLNQRFQSLDDPLQKFSATFQPNPLSYGAWAHGMAGLSDDC